MVTDGVSVREHLEAVERQTGITPKALRGPDCPFEFDRVFLLWSEIHAGRSSNGMGLTPLTWVDIAAWRDLTGELVTPDEIRVIRKVDGWWLDIMTAERKADGRHSPDRKR